MSKDTEDIKYRARCIGVDMEMVVQDFLKKYPGFEIWSGSSKKTTHHYGQGGLARHTNEIIQLGFNARSILNIPGKVDEREFFMGALFHDAGKMYDYAPVDEHYQEWTGTPHKRMIYHLSRSALIWSEFIKDYPDLNAKYHDDVLHAILAHHGQREWGSPVAPKTPAAWLVHLCDMMSARMDDCDKMDIVKEDKK